MCFRALLIVVFLLTQLALISDVKASNLLKTKDLKKTTKTKSEKIDTEKNKEDDSTGKNALEASDVEEAEEKEEINPSQVYKLVAIYLVNKQPRALIKNTTVPEEGAMEYQIGDYLDELQTFSISKISFNPTARIELIDQNGLSYLIKPSESGGRTSSTGKSYYGSKTSPSRFSVGSSKAKSRKDVETVTATQEKQEKKEEQVKAQTESEVKKEEVTTTTQQASASTSLQAATQGTSSTAQVSESKAQASPPPSKPPDALDVSRPANPFAQ